PLHLVVGQHSHPRIGTVGRPRRPCRPAPRRIGSRHSPAGSVLVVVGRAAVPTPRAAVAAGGYPRRRPARPLRQATPISPGPDPNARHRDVTLVDGGTGSELRRRGVPLSPAAWSALAAESHYDLLVAIHADYIRAGADVVTTSTFAGTRFVLDAAGRAADFE